MSIEEKYMGECLKLAANGRGHVSPNPMVGAVLVYDNKIIGQGYHEKLGLAHAEVNCINSVKKEDKHLIKLSTLYVSLEPCSHTGRTPPCTDFILQHEIKKVVIACQDHSNKVNGKGITKLRSSGVEVVEHILEEQAITLNERFFTFHQKKRPFIILKWAESKEGFVGKMDAPIKLSQSETDVIVHQWRSEEDAIWIGFNTVKVDNPILNVRHIKGKDPIRVTIDRNMQLDGKYNLLNNQQPTLIFNQVLNKKEGMIEWEITKPEFEIEQVLLSLYNREISSVIIEGGASLLNRFIKLNLWDEVRLILTNTSLNEGVLAPLFDKGRPHQCVISSSDKILSYRNKTT